jgi:hypothetical protein
MKGIRKPIVPIKAIKLKKLKMSKDVNEIVKESIHIFNVVDIIKPNSLSKITFYNLFYHNLLKIMSKEIEINVNMSGNLILFIILLTLYKNNKIKINKLLIPSTIKESRYITIFINFIIYWLFKDVLNVY